EAWATASRAAVPQVEAMITVGQNIAESANDGKLTQSDYDALKSMQKKAFKGILSSHVGVSIVVAEQAATAAWDVLEIAGLPGDFSTSPKGVVGGLAGKMSTSPKGLVG